MENFSAGILSPTDREITFAVISICSLLNDLCTRAKNPIHFAVYETYGFRLSVQNTES